MNAIILAIFAIAGTGSDTRDDYAQAREPFHRIIIKPDKGRVSEITHDDKKVRIEDIYDESSAVMIASGRSARYAVIFSDNSAFSSVIEVNQILSAVGFLNVRYFVSDENEDYMTEINFSHNFPYGNPYKRVIDGIEEGWPSKVTKK